MNRSLPRPHRRRYEPIEVRELNLATRGDYGLSTPETYVEVTTDEGVREAMEYAYEAGVVGFDSETTGLDIHEDEPVLLQVGDEEKQFLIWLEDVDVAPILELIRSPDVCKVGWNVKYDLKMFMAQYGLVEARPANMADAQLVEQILSCGLLGPPGAVLGRTSLGSSTQRWFGLKLPKDKELRTGWKPYRPSVFKGRLPGLSEEEQEKEKAHRAEKMLYAADDVILPLRMLRKLTPWIREFELVPTVQLEMKFLPVLATSEVRGMKVDKEQWQALTDEAKELVKQTYRELDEVFDTPVRIRVFEDESVEVTRGINYGSRLQLADAVRGWMWDNYGVDVILTNDHFRESLERYGRMNQARINVLFEKRMEPNPEKPGSKKKVAYPNMTDVVDDWWDEYHKFLPDEAFVLPNTESDTFKLLRVIHETPEDEVDPHLPTTVGLPPALVDPIVTLRAAEQTVQYFGDNWLEFVRDEDSRIYPTFLQCALSTGRLSSRPNVQNLPADERRRACFVADEGHLFVGFDWSQIEPRITGHLSKDPLYMRTYWSEFPDTEGFDRWCGPHVKEPQGIYTEVGKEVGIIPAHFTLAETKGTADEDPHPDGKKGRDQAKITVLSKAYGTGLWKFYLKLIRDTEEHHTLRHAKKLYYGLEDSAPEAKRTLDDMSALADWDKSRRRAWHPHAGGEVTWSETLLGRKRFFTKGAPTWTTGRNQPIQGTGADILKHTGLLFQEWAWENDVDGVIVNWLHDEFLFEVPAEDAARSSDKLKLLMTRVGEHYCPSVPITADGYVADHWIKD